MWTKALKIMSDSNYFTVVSLQLSKEKWNTAGILELSYTDFHRREFQLQPAKPYKNTSSALCTVSFHDPVQFWKGYICLRDLIFFPADFSLARKQPLKHYFFFTDSKSMTDLFIVAVVLIIHISVISKQLDQQLQIYIRKRKW